MSYESTQYLSRTDAENMLRGVLTEKLAYVHTMGDEELERLLYVLTRQTHYFDNFRIGDF